MSAGNLWLLLLYRNGKKGIQQVESVAMLDKILRFPSAFCRRRAGKFCGRNLSRFGVSIDVINHCISIATIDTAENDAYLAGITNSQDYGVTNCYFNNDVCNVEEKYQLGRSNN